MASRNLQQLEKAIEKAEKAELEKKLGLQMQMAYRIRDQVSSIKWNKTHGQTFQRAFHKTK